MGIPKLIYPSDFRPGHFYEDLEKSIFCWLEREGKMIPVYINGYSPLSSLSPKRPRVSTNIILFQGVLEINPEEYLKTLESEANSFRSILEKLAEEDQF